MRSDLRRRDGFYTKTAALTVLLLMVVPGITALGTDPDTAATIDDGGETLVIFNGATRQQFDAVAGAIFEEGGEPFALNPPNALRALLPPGVGSSILAMEGVHSVHTDKVDMRAVKGMDRDVQVAASAWNLRVEELERGYSPDTLHGPVAHDHTGIVTSISDRSAGTDADVGSGPLFHHGMAQIYDDAIVCDETGRCTNDRAEARRMMASMREDGGTFPMSDPQPLSPGPGPSDTSEFMIGSVGVAIVFPESNGSIDSNQETWTSGEETNVINEITNAFNWWTARKNGFGITVPLTWSYTAYYKQPTSYEPITRNGYTGNQNANMWTWMNEIQGDLGFANGIAGARAFANYTRAQLGTDWGYITWVADSTVDGNGQFADNTFGFALLGGPYVVMTYDNDGYGIGSMDAVMAHESCHIFYALDEYSGSGADSGDRSGYENVLNGNAVAVGTPGPITNQGCIMRGGSSPFSNNQVCGFTRGQIGLNDTDGDGIPNVLDTAPRSTIDAMPNGFTNSTTYTYYGNVSVQPATNNNPYGWGNDVTINTINLVQYRLDGGTWTSTTAIDGAWSNHTEAYKFTLTGLTEGSHMVEVRCRNNRNIWEATPVNDSFLVDATAPTSEAGPQPQYQNGNTLSVDWTADDGTGSGVQKVELWYRRGGGAWTRHGSAFTTSPIIFIHGMDGFYELYTIAIDNASNRELPPLEADASTTVENVPPTSSLGPLPEFTSQVTFDVIFNASDDGVGLDYVELNYRKDGSSWSVYDTSDQAEGTFSFASSGDGEYDFYIVSYDILGNDEYKVPQPEVSTTVDTILPTTTVTLTGAEGENDWYTSNVSVRMTTDEPVGHLNYTEYAMDGGIWTVYDGTFIIPGDGIFNITYNSVDKAGNTEAEKYVDLKIDTSAPTGSIVINDGTLELKDPQVTVHLAAEDDVAPPTQMMVTEDGSFSLGTWVNITSTMPYTFSMDPGTKTLYAKFMNEAGLVSDVYSASVVVDTEGPTIEIDEPGDGDVLAVYEFVVRGETNDNLGIDLVELSLDGAGWEPCNGTESWDHIVSVPSDGTYTIRARTFDLVGNEANASITISVDASLPTVEMDGPKDNTVTEAKKIPVEGTTDPDAIVKINGAVVDVEEDGHFSTIVSLEEGSNTITVSVTKPAGTIEKKIRVIYVHPPIIISDLKHRPDQPDRDDIITISCVVPGSHIVEVNLKWRLFGGALETLPMTKGDGDTFTADIGPFEMGGTIEYYVEAVDDISKLGRFPEKDERSFFIPHPELPPEPEEEDENEGYGMFGWVFLIVIFVVIAALIALGMRKPKQPEGFGPKRVSSRTAEERIDPDMADDRPPPRDRGRPQSRMRESDRYRAGDGESRFRDDDL